MNKSPGEDRQKKPAQPAAQPGKLALVQCEGFRCLAYCDKDGTWRDRRGQILTGRVTFLEEADDRMQSLWPDSGRS